MKKSYIYSWFALIASIVPASCSQDDVITENNTSGTVINVTVTDNGYNGSRAEDNGLTTTFTAGDRIGLFAVKDGQIANGINNVCLTATAGADNSVTWSTADGTIISDTPGSIYFAYYPYTDALPAQVNLSATDAQGFFAPVTAAWATKADQSNYSDYTASDLMTASSTPDNGHLSFAMEHRMSLIIINLPSTKYVFTNEPAIPDYTLFSAEDATFTDMTPLRIQPGKFAYLANPAASSLKVAGAYSLNSVERQWEFNAALTAGTANTYNIDPDKGTGAISHLLQVGDFFLADGSLLSKDAPAAEVQNADVIGIVYCIDPSRIGEAEKAALGGTAHGLVLSTKAISNGQYGVFAWSSKMTDETAFGMTDLCGTDAAATYLNADANISGLTNMNIIRDKHAAEYASDVYEAFKATAEFGSSHKDYNTLKKVTTGWYIPSLGQWFDIIRNLGNATINNTEDFRFGDYPYMLYWINRGTVMSNLNNAMAKVSSDSKDEYTTKTWLWTSSITSDNWVFYVELAFTVNITDGTGGLNSFSCFPGRKTSYNVIHGVLAF